MTPEVIFRREKKWINMLNSWDYYMKHKFAKVKERCRKGIPHSLRVRAWLYLCGGKSLMEQHPRLYEDLLTKPAKDEHIRDINKDLHRLFPDHEMFVENAQGRQELFCVLKAYSILNSQVGYCQAQGVIAAFLLMHMPAEQAFWSFVAICDKYLIGYYSHNMEVLVRDGNLLFALLKKVSPVAYKHLVKNFFLKFYDLYFLYRFFNTSISCIYYFIYQNY